MAKRCSNCEKGVLYGHNVSHAKNRTRKVFQPNLHSARVLVGANRQRLKLCTKCLRMYRELERVLKTASNAAPAAEKKTETVIAAS